MESKKTDSGQHELSRAAAKLGGISSSGIRRYLRMRAETSADVNLKSNLQYLIAIRVILLTIIFSSLVWTQIGDLQALAESRAVFVVFALTYGISLANSVLLRRVRNLNAFGYLHLSVDVLLASLAIYTTQSLVMISLYLFVIVAAAFLLGRQGAVFIAALCGITYSILATGLLFSGPGHQLQSSPQDILGVYTSLVVIAFASSYLARQLEQAGVKIANSERNLTQISSQQKQLFNGMSEGVITVDLTSVVTGINEAARAILGLTEINTEQFVGKPVTSALKDHGLEQVATLLVSDQALTPAVSEIVVQRAPDRPEVRLTCNVKPLVDHDGHQSGKIVRFSDVSRLRSMEERLTLHERMTELLAQTHSNPVLDPNSSKSYLEMIGDSSPIRAVKELIDRVSQSDASVLITGESGTGKELIARSIHERGKRAKKPFVAINCGAIPENLIESELFGHRKGSFTGAVVDKHGLFREAEGGTIFLDEIGELPLLLQTKLLRVLQERTIRPVGDNRDTPVDVRIVAATNRDLKQEVASGRFRDDLYYRLNVVQIGVPPLRERKVDIPLLVRHFVSRMPLADGGIPHISPEALQILTAYSFPGNIRELENLIERALVLGGSAILPAHLPDEVVSTFAEHMRPALLDNGTKSETSVVILPIDLEGELQRLEQHYLTRALEESAGVKKNAAKLLGLNFRSFRYRLKKYGLSAEDDV